MIAIRILCLLLCECFYFVIVNSQSTVDESSGQCPWNNDEYLLQTFERTCKPTQQLLRVNQQLLHRHEQLLNQMKQSMDNMSAQLMSIKNQQSSTTERDADDKQQFVSALLTGRSRGVDPGG